MTSKRYQPEPPHRVWFPSREADEALLIQYLPRSRSLEITAMGTASFSAGTFRISLHDFLFGLGISDDEITRPRR